MYKIAALITASIALTDASYAAEKAQVNCKKGEDSKLLLDGKSISLNSKGEPKTYSMPYFQKQCEDAFGSETTEDESAEKSDAVKVELKKVS